MAINLRFVQIFRNVVKKDRGYANENHSKHD